MVEESAKEEWVWMLTERPPDRDEDESRYVQAWVKAGSCCWNSWQPRMQT
jgi:hypothetical protein